MTRRTIIEKKRLKLVIIGFVSAILTIGSTSAIALANEASDFIVDPYRAYSYENMLEDAKELQALYPDLIRVKSIGQSVEGRDLTLIELGNGNRKIFLCGATHAREYISTTYLMYMIDRYAFAYSNGGIYEGYDIAKLLNGVTFCIVPLSNPDGVNLVQNGINAVKDYEAVSKIAINKTDRHGYASWKANINGVDLNKNYPYNWYVSSSVNAPASSSFKGYAPLSEPETKAIVDYLNTTMCWSYITFHSQGEGIYGWNDSNVSYYPQLNAMVSRIMKTSGFHKFTDSAGMNYGSFAEYVRRTYLKPALTIELCESVGSYPYPNKDFNKVWAPAKSINLIVADEVLKMKPQDYQVYQNNTFLHGFISEKYALTYARKWANSIVLYTRGSVDTFGSIVPDDISVLINGSNVIFQVFNVDGSNYMKLRDLALALSATDKQFEVGYDSINSTIVLTSKTAYTVVASDLPASGGPVSLFVTPSKATVQLDDAIIDLKGYNIGGSNYFKLVDIGAALDLGVTYDSATGIINLEKPVAPIN